MHLSSTVHWLMCNNRKAVCQSGVPQRPQAPFVEIFRTSTESTREGVHWRISGDGVKDGPSLKRADVGIAMGTRSDVAKESSDIIITDDNFASILNAIEESRYIVDNIQKFILHVLAANVGFVMTLLVGLAFKDNNGVSSLRTLANEYLTFGSQTGAGDIGPCFLEQLAWVAKHRSSPCLRLCYVAIIDKALYHPDYAHIDIGTALSTLESVGQALPTVPQIIDYLSRAPGRVIVVDNTSSQEIAESYPQLLSRGMGVVTPNKKAFSGNLKLWHDIIAVQGFAGSMVVMNARSALLCLLSVL
ncbi:Homoserine dehydrogenase [Tolypocladium paradoxum]|uniref:Homoserine dehydrogenase n=1 Tax=Tolypocladium paradoxum TaxID=94208 RepID=A0A2S4L2E5_9HYPO|nr:Homoserine dehydrogenase [Tolypocladium paradoxum]